LENLYPNNGNKECCFMMRVGDIADALELLPAVYLLLDLGHLKISSSTLGFDYLKAVEFLFEKYADRILEIHLSENNAFNDNHFPVYSDSVQYEIVCNYKELIKAKNINVTIEARNSAREDLLECYLLIDNALKG
jgi:uncharacterized protein (UPF0276 family)